ncbi:MAG: hypothetical protein RSF81_08015, partial [Oscillospiraceae bacterium]
MLLILCYMLLVYGLWEVMTYKIVCPSKSARKAVGTYSVKKEKFYITLLLPLSKRICNYIPLTENKLEKLDITLKTVGFDDSAKVYICKAYSQSMFYFFIGIIVYFFYSPTFSILCFAFSILSYKQYMKKPFVKLEEKRKVIEKELARLSSTISNSLYTTKDVITILKNYTQVTS